MGGGVPGSKQAHRKTRDPVSRSHMAQVDATTTTGVESRGPREQVLVRGVESPPRFAGTFGPFLWGQINKASGFAGGYLLPAPVWHVVVAGSRELMLLCPVGEHRPNLRVAADGSFKDDVTPIGRPGREVVAARFMGELEPTQRLAGDVHYINILAAGRARTVFAIPAKGEELSVGRPRRRDCVTAVGQALDIGAVLIHGVNLRQPRTAAHPGNLRIGAGVPSWRDIGPSEGRYLAWITAACIRNPNLRIA